MEIVINKCFGGFGLSPKAVSRLAELKGMKAYFFTLGFGEKRRMISEEEAYSEFSWVAKKMPNPSCMDESQPNFYSLSQEEKMERNRIYDEESIDTCPSNRTDPDLIRVVKELGDAASGKYAKLKVIEIPDGVEWEIDEYDGMETVREKHRSWN